MMRHSLTAVLLAAALAAPAFAQVPAGKAGTDGSTSVTGQLGFVQQQSANEWRGTKLIGASVYGPDNASIGEINDVLIAGDGKVHAVVIGVGSFLGAADKDIAVPFEALSVTRQPDSSSIARISVTYSKDQLKNAPDFAYNGAAQSQTTGSSASDRLRSLAPDGGGPKP